MTPLDIPVIGFQILLPISLLAWFLLAPARSGLGYGIQFSAITLCLIALCLVPVWLVPPWWSPFAMIITFLIITVNHLVSHRIPTSPLMPHGRLAWASAIALFFVGTWAGTMSVSAVAGRSVPQGYVIDLNFPMGPGTYLVANGGSSETINGHFLTLNPTTERQRNYRGQSYGIDLIKVNRMGLRASSWRPRDPQSYEIFGEPIYAPCGGTVLSASGGMPDMPVPERDTNRLEGNHVVLDCGGFGVVLAHFRSGSLRVAVGDEVRVGQQVAEAGNSGQSTEPHLHIHAQRLPTEGPLLSGEPLFATLNGHFASRNDRIVIEKGD